MSLIFCGCALLSVNGDKKGKLMVVQFELHEFKKRTTAEQCFADDEQKRDPMTTVDKLMLVAFIVGSWGVVIGVYFGINSLISRWAQ